MNQVAAVVMAAGKGVRMKSELPKVLVEFKNRPMVEYVLDALAFGGVDKTVVVVGYKSELVESTLCAHNASSGKSPERWPGLTFALQTTQRGTADAVQCAFDALKDFSGPVVVLAGDQPLTSGKTIAKMLQVWKENPVACLIGTVERENPFGFGRIIRDPAGNFTGIVEEKDATPEQKLIREVNVSYYVFNAADLWAAIKEVKPNNAQGEYYLTDCPAALIKAGKTVRAEILLLPQESYSINTKEQLEEAEKLVKSEE